MRVWTVRVLLADHTWLEIPDVLVYYLGDSRTLYLELASGEHLAFAVGRWQQYSATPKESV